MLLVFGMSLYIRVNACDSDEVFFRFFMCRALVILLHGLNEHRYYTWFIVASKLIL
jgi:hypothetical protein